MVNENDRDLPGWFGTLLQKLDDEERQRFHRLGRNVRKGSYVQNAIILAVKQTFDSQSKDGRLDNTVENHLVEQLRWLLESNDL